MKLTLVASALTIALASGASAQSWNGYGGNAQHSAVYTGPSQTVGKVHWQAPLDDSPSYFGGSVIIHYASVMITRSNTVIHGYRFTTTVNGNPDYDNWRVIARNAETGYQLWQLTTDYSAPLVYPTDWTSVFPLTLCPVGGGSTGLVSGAAGGSIVVRTSADAASSAANRYVFYTTLQDFNNHEAAYSPIKINTPLTADSEGNVYFGYDVTAPIPSNLSSLGTGGVAKVNATTGQAIFRSIESLGIDSSLTRPAMNAAPALSSDGTAVYFGLTGGDAVLAKLSTTSLSATAHVQLFDPSVSGGTAFLIDESSAAPMVGPDGHVFLGVFGNQWRESHGWMLQFDANLDQRDASSKLYPVGSFGWDDTPSVVPVSIVPSYKGKASYLILTKYNNYDDDGSDAGADGSNKVAVIDPTSNSITKDRQSGIPVMNEILTVLSPTLSKDDPQHPNSRAEWCINSAAVDVNKRGAIVNCEDGHLYRWNFVTNTLSEALDLQPPTGEAYTSTAIGPDGQLYAINNAILFAVGDPAKASAVSVYQGTAGSGALQDIWYLDGSTYSTGSVNSSTGQEAAIEADFVFSNSSINGLSVSSYEAAATGASGFIYAYNYTSKSFVLLSSGFLSTSQTLLVGSTSSNGSQFLGPGGMVRILVRAVVPPHVSTQPFRLATDQITCGVN
jgi:hypothetical protein